MRDYFKEALIPKDDMEGIRPDIAELINTDVNNYREHMIKQYNGDEEKATDEFCLLDDLQVIGTANMADGTLHIDLVCTNWNKRFETDWIPEYR